MKKRIKTSIAAMLTAAMTLSSFMGTITVYADEPADPDQEIVLTEVPETEDAGLAETEINSGITDDVGTNELAAEDIEENELVTDDIDTNEPAADDEDLTGVAVNGDIVIPETEGRVLRLASAGMGIQKQQHIYFGKMDQGNYNYWDTEGEQKPYWRVLDPGKDNAGGSGAILVMSEMLWGNNPDDLSNGGIAFNTDRSKENANVWQGSDAGIWCSNFLANSFSEPERVVIRSINKRDDAVTGDWKTCYLKGDKVFFLSVAELEKYLGTNKYDYGAEYMAMA